jgi:hypothetical protein
MKKIALTSLAAMFAVGAISGAYADDTKVIASKAYVDNRDGDLVFTGIASGQSDLTAAINVIEAAVSDLDAAQLTSGIATTVSSDGEIDVDFNSGHFTSDGDQLNIKAGGVGTTELADSAVTSAKIADAAVITAKISDGAVATAKIADAAVVTAKISDGAVTIGKVDAAAIDTSIASDSTDSALATGKAVYDFVSAEISDAIDQTTYYADEDTLTLGSDNHFKVSDGGIDTAQIADNAVVTAKISDGAVTSAKILDGTIVNADISDATINTGKMNIVQTCPAAKLAAGMTSDSTLAHCVLTGSETDGWKYEVVIH